MSDTQDIYDNQAAEPNDDNETPFIQEDEDEIIEENVPEPIDEPEEQLDTDISLSNVERSRITIAGRDLYVLDFVRQGIKVAPVNPLDVEKIQAVFVEPREYQEGLDKLHRQRLLIIRGQSHIGKSAMALRIAYNTQAAKENMAMHVLRFSEDASLGDFLDDEACPENSVFLIPDAFVVPGLSITEIQRHASQLSVFLEQKDSFAILTIDTTQNEQIELPDQYSIEITGYARGMLSQILDKHVDYYNTSDQHRQLISSRRAHIANTLGYANNIDRFVQNVAREKSLDETTLQEILLSTANTKVEAQNWFAQRTANERYYGMLVSLCPNLSKDKLWIVYDKIISSLQSKKVEIKPSLDAPEEELQKSNRTRINEVGALDFEDSTYKDFVLERVVFSYIQQFRFFLPVFSDLVIQNRSNRSADAKTIRIAMANAVGEICKAGLEPCIPTLYGWASHEDATVRTSVAHALRKTANDVLKRNDVLGLLERWRNNPNSRIRWTVAATWERLFPYLPDNAISELGALSDDRANFVRSAVSHAMASIARRDQEAVLDAINEWIFDVEPYRRKTAANAFLRVITERRTGRNLFVESDAKIRTLPILVELCSLGGTQFTQAMGLIQQWVENSDEYLRQVIEDSLLKLCRNGTAQIREAMLDTLKSDWTQSESEEIYRFAVVLTDLIQQLPPPSRFEFDFTRNQPDFEIHDVQEDDDFSVED